jgi:hypothetical protein
MSKNSSPKYGEVDDYLAQVEWQNQQSQRRVPLPWHMEPKWVYKRVGASNKSSDATVVRIFMAVIGIACGSLWYFRGTDALPLLTFLLFIGIFLVQMIRDANPQNRR